MQIITKRKDGSTDVATLNEEPSMTQQQFKEECDINNIMRKYEQTGQITHINRKQGVYADLSNIKDYQEMLHTIHHAEEAFNTLPAEVRYKFRNDPTKLIAFLQDTSNREEAIKLGLIERNDETKTTTQPKSEAAQSPKTQ